ncbi:hypothetical protein ACFLT5_01990 [Chloroflexota bacterium]
MTESIEGLTENMMAAWEACRGTLELTDFNTLPSEANLHYLGAATVFGIQAMFLQQSLITKTLLEISQNMNKLLAYTVLGEEVLNTEEWKDSR